MDGIVVLQKLTALLAEVLEKHGWTEQARDAFFGGIEEVMKSCSSEELVAFCELRLPSSVYALSRGTALRVLKSR